MKCFIPENLVIDELLKNHPPEKIEGFRFNKDHLIYILNLIFHIPSENPKANVINGFVPIKARKLTTKIRGYQVYIDYLLKYEVWISDRHYIPGKKCIGYAYSDKYLSKPNEISFENRRGTCFESWSENEADRETFAHIVAGLNPNLKILYKQAIEFIDTQFQLKSTNTVSGSVERRIQQIRYLRALHGINKINNSYFPWKVDESIRRFYSPITGMPKEVRQFIYYENDQLATFDMKNSQPFILLAILKREFWEPSDKDLINIHEILKFNKSNYFHNNYSNKYNSLIKAIMVDNLEKIDFKNEVICYANLASSGKLYQKLGYAQLKYNEIEILDEAEFKRDFLKGLFSDNRNISFDRALAKFIFKNEFPQIYQFIATLKRSEKKWFSRLLQTIESYLFLIKIGQRLYKEGYEFQTIHDCIVAKSKYKRQILDIMDSEVYKAIGYHPTFDYKPWLDPNSFSNQAITQNTENIVSTMRNNDSLERCHGLRRTL